MKLELKHIAPYLPYGVGVEYKRNIYPKETTHSVLSINMLRLCDLSPLKFSIKPPLRPLSDLYKEIDGVVGIVELAKIEHPCSSYHILRHKVVEVACDDQSSMSFKYDPDENYFINSNFDCDDENYPIMYQLDLFTYLFSHHYDVFGLIDKGLAIDLSFTQR